MSQETLNDLNETARQAGRSGDGQTVVETTEEILRRLQEAAQKAGGTYENQVAAVNKTIKDAQKGT